ncbi:hypothetical protein [Cupriavidus nantongensis]|uniref:Uncharacterized protein n=1 Tax=Cupriavidus nantongensis TaxID=1796606 RepID=A0A142JIN6_9BURK|nr:hypothetical protein [Cupriavidus nantongensis]AMR77948.1 hypothetical protein A2G96_09455 [Cupriavidus nantongensis]
MDAAERENAVREGFIQGVAFAAAVAVQLHGQPTIARSIVNETGFDLEAFSVAAEDDLVHLRAEVKGLPRGRE